MTTNDEGTWTCRDGGSGPPGCEIVSSRLPGETASSIALDPGNSLKVNDVLNITVILIEYYCSQSVSFNISFNGTQVPLTGIPTSKSVFNNASTEVSVQVTEKMAGPMRMVMECGGKMFDVTVIGLTSLDIATPPSTPGCLCQCSCACERTSTIVLIVIIILLVITVAVVIAFIIIFCVYNIRKYNDQYRLAVFIGAIVVCIVAIACTIVVFVLSSTVEKIQADGEECCCSTCDPDGEEMKNKCVGLKISAAFFCILVAVLMLIIIIIILIVWCCPGKSGTAKLLMLCGTPSNTVTPTQAKPKSPVEKSTGTSSHSGRQQSGNKTTGKGTDVRMLQTNTTTDSPSGTLTPIDFSKLSNLSPGIPLAPRNKSPDDAIDEEETSKDHEENGTVSVTKKKKSSKKRKKKTRSKSGEKTKKETTSCPGRDSDGSAASLA